MSDAGHTTPSGPRRHTRQGQVKVSEAEVLRLVEEVGLASVSQVYQRLIAGGSVSITYLAVGSVLRELAKQGRLAVARDGHRLLYRLRGPDDAAPPPRSLPTTYPPRPKLPLRRRWDVPLTALDEAVLEAIRKLGRANLDQIYRALARPVGASYPEFVHAVRELVQHRRLVSRVQEHARSFYQLAK